MDVSRSLFLPSTLPNLQSKECNRVSAGEEAPIISVASQAAAVGSLPSKMVMLRSIATAHVAACCWLMGLALARRHHLFVGNLHLPAALHSLVFDDESLQLNVSRTMAADSSHVWITFNARSTSPAFPGEPSWLTRCPA